MEEPLTKEGHSHGTRHVPALGDHASDPASSAFCCETGDATSRGRDSFCGSCQGRFFGPPPLCFHNRQKYRHAERESLPFTLQFGGVAPDGVSPILNEFGVAQAPVTRVYSINLHFCVGSVSNLPVLDRKYRWILKYTSSAEVRRLHRPSIICRCCAAIPTRGATASTWVRCIVRHTLLLRDVLTTH